MERSYNAMGWLVKEEQGREATISYSYDLVGRLVSRTSAVKVEGTTKTRTVNYDYDALGQVTSIAIPGHDPIGLVRNALGEITHEQLSPGLERRFFYSSAGYLTIQGVFNGEGPLFRQEYRYDKAGNLLWKEDSVFGTDQFGYDPLGRIIQYTDPAKRFAKHLYDPAGDLLATKVQDEGPEWKRTGSYERTDYAFDRAGNLVERTGDKDQTALAWDVNGRLVESVRNGRTTKYQYDPLGRRVSKTTDGAVTRFYWDGDALLGDGTGETSREWVYYPGGFEPLAMVRDEKLYLYHNDPNGCPTRLMEPDGKVVWAAKYDAWGSMERLAEDTVDQPLRLQGQYFDGETGLGYNRFRYYCYETGSFISQDPLGLMAGENVYGFGPNVQAWMDPLGLSCKETNKKYYRYVGEGEAEVIRKTGKIPNVDRDGNAKDVYFTNRKYNTAGRAKTHNQLPSKPAYRVEIDAANVPNHSPFTKVNPADNPQWGIGGGVESTTRDAISVDPSTLTRLKGANL